MNAPSRSSTVVIGGTSLKRRRQFLGDGVVCLGLDIKETGKEGADSF